MEATLNVFLNGLGGVFLGIAVLYVIIKLLARVPDRPGDDKD